MPRTATALKSSRHHIVLFDEDWEFLNRAFGKPDGVHPIGVSEAIRAIVHKRVLALKNRANAQYDAEQSRDAGESESAEELGL